LAEVKKAIQDSQRVSVMVGFNRRFAPATQLVKEFFGNTKSPRNVLIRVNAGEIPGDHWIQDPKVGGGRLIGEGCHFVDLAVALTGSPIRRISTSAMPKPGVPPTVWDDFAIAFEHEDGSISSVIYTSIGDSAVAKERIEVHAGGRSAIIDDFRRVETFASGKRTVKSWSQQDKGQQQEMQSWLDGIRSGASPIPLAEILNVHEACLAALRSIQQGGAVEL
jgi:polar amino acid transport system substrate-binding protein